MVLREDSRKLAYLIAILTFAADADQAADEVEDGPGPPS